MMKRYLLIIVFVNLSVFCHAQDSLNYMRTSKVKPLTALDRKNYVLTINQNKLAKLKYTPPNGKNNYYRKTVLFVPVKLTNNSNDTLKYLSMTCSWEEFYLVDKREIAGIPIEECIKNIPCTIMLPPHKSFIIRIPVIKIQRGKKFRIGMTLIKLFKETNLLDLFSIDRSSLSKNVNYIIWSNAVELPQ